jgi:prepilin peptidase CpaA
MGLHHDAGRSIPSLRIFTADAIAGGNTGRRRSVALSGRPTSMIWPMTAWATEAAAFACLLAAAANDIMARIIPNRLVLAVMIAGFSLRLLPGPGMLWASLAVWAVVLGLLAVPASYAVLGWGDAKLIAAVTLLVPPGEVVSLLPAIAIAGGVLACAYLAARQVLRYTTPPCVQSPGIPRPGLAGILDREHARILAKEPMPYALAVLGGVAYQTASEAVRCWPATYCWR